MVTGGIETLLPSERRLDYAVEILQLELDELFAERALDSDEVLDPASELSRDVLMLSELSWWMATMLASESEDRDRVAHNMYRGMSFALDTIDAVSQEHESAGKLPLSSIIDISETPGSVEMLADSLRSEVTTYLSASPHICALIDRYMHEIDHDVMPHHVEIAAGMMLLLYERAIAEHEIETSVEQASVDDFLS